MVVHQEGETATSSVTGRDSCPAQQLGSKEKDLSVPFWAQSAAGIVSGPFTQSHVQHKP